MADWLKTCGIETVVMQSTGVYWIALYDVVEKRGFKMCLANARHTKNLPGRKSDVQESQWLLKLHTYGLLRNSFRPPHEIRALRSLWRLRDRHVKEAARTVQHMQKSLITMNVQLSNTISDLSGTTDWLSSGRSWLERGIRRSWRNCEIGGLRPAKKRWRAAWSATGGRHAV